MSFRSDVIDHFTKHGTDAKPAFVFLKADNRAVFVGNASDIRNADALCMKAGYEGTFCSRAVLNDAPGTGEFFVMHGNALKAA